LLPAARLLQPLLPATALLLPQKPRCSFSPELLLLPATALLLVLLTIGPGGGGRCQSPGGNMPASSTSHTSTSSPSYALLCLVTRGNIYCLTSVYQLHAGITLLPNARCVLQSLQDLHMCTRNLLLHTGRQAPATANFAD
jgi:hypothetical protein